MYRKIWGITIMKKTLCIAIISVLCAFVLCVTAGGCSKEAEPINYDIYTVGVSLDDMRAFGSGVVLKQENGKIYHRSVNVLYRFVNHQMMTLVLPAV